MLICILFSFSVFNPYSQNWLLSRCQRLLSPYSHTKLIIQGNVWIHKKVPNPVWMNCVTDWAIPFARTSWNLTELLTKEPENNFIGKSVLEAIAFKNSKGIIYEINNHLDILPANNFLAHFSRWIYRNESPNVSDKIYYEGNPYEQLDGLLKLVKDKYDYILIDLHQHCLNKLLMLCMQVIMSLFFMKVRNFVIPPFQIFIWQAPSNLKLTVVSYSYNPESSFLSL